MHYTDIAIFVLEHFIQTQPVDVDSTPRHWVVVGDGLVRADDGPVELVGETAAAAGVAVAVAALRDRFCWARRRRLSSTDISPPANDLSSQQQTVDCHRHLSTFA